MEARQGRSNTQNNEGQLLVCACLLVGWLQLKPLASGSVPREPKQFLIFDPQVPNILGILGGGGVPPPPLVSGSGPHQPPGPLKYKTCKTYRTPPHLILPPPRVVDDGQKLRGRCSGKLETGAGAPCDVPRQSPVPLAWTMAQG